MLGHPDAIIIITVVAQNLVYDFGYQKSWREGISIQILPCSTAQASLSRTGDTNGGGGGGGGGEFFLNLVANRSTWGVCHFWQIW